jgi:hypothetical protein
VVGTQIAAPDHTSGRPVSSNSIPASKDSDLRRRERITEKDAWFSNLRKLRGERNEHLDNLVRASADSLAWRSNRVSRGGWANPPVARVRSNLADSTFCDGYADRVNNSEPWTEIAPVTMSRDGRFLAEYQYFGKWPLWHT